MAVDVQNIIKYYGNQCVLNNISFTLKEGSITGFLGPNGAGKTTMMNIITGYLQKWEGNVTIYGKDTREEARETKRIIGYLHEHNPLDEQLYIKEYLRYVAKFYLPTSEINKAVTDIINKVGLKREQHKKIGQLSKGYRQRVGLANALINNPKLLILDEPTNGLDPNQIEEIRQLIREVGQNRIVLLSTHIMQEVKSLCNRTIIINKGQLVRDSKDNNQTEQQIVNIAFTQEVALSELPFISSVKDEGNYNYIVHSNSKEDIRPMLFNFAKNNNLTLLHLAKKNIDIAKTFQDITK